MRRGLFSFREDPFRNHPDPRFFYPSPDYRKAYGRLLARTREASGLALLLGSSGVGKTTLLAKLRHDLEAAGFCVICPAPGPPAPGGLLAQCCQAVDLPLAENTAAEAERVLSKHLQAQRADEREIALIVDDAHLLQPTALVDLWDLVQASAGAKQATSVVLAGRFELETHLRSPGLSKINHAISARVTLKPLEPRHIGAFIRHRLWIVGYTGPELFTDEAILRIADYSKGVPSLINLICGLSLKFARVISEAVVSAEAVDDMQKFLGNIGPSASAARPQSYDPQSIARLQKLYDLLSLPHLRDGEEPPAVLDALEPMPAPHEDGISAERDLLRAISNALDWQPMPIEEKVDEKVDEKEVAVPDAVLKAEPAFRPKGTMRPLIPLAAGIALVALVAGGIAWLYQPDLNVRLMSIADLKSSSETWRPDNDFAGLEKVLGSDPAAKPPSQIPWQPTFTKSPPTDAPQAASEGLLDVAPAAESEGPLLSDSVELSPVEVADPPVLEVIDAAGVEGGEVALSVVARLAEDAGEEDLTVSVSGLPARARLSAGTRQADGSWRLTPADLVDLTMSVAPGTSGEIPLTVTATTTAPGGNSATTSATLRMSLAAVADPPVLEVADAAGTEGGEVALLVVARLAEDAGEEDLTVSVSGLPAGARLSAGAAQVDGSWQLTLPDLAGLTMSVAPGTSGEIPLTVTATTTAPGGDSASSTATLRVSLAAVADPPVLEVADAAGVEGEEVALSIMARLAEDAGEEELMVLLSGLPAGAQLSAGTALADGSWALTAGDLSGLTMSVAPGTSGEIPLTIAATTTAPGGDSATTFATLRVSLEAAPQVVPESKPAVSTEEPSIELLLAKGKKLQKLGDIAAARLFFELAAEFGSPVAAKLMGETFDPIELKKAGIVGLKGDPIEAVEWYQRAISAGEGSAVKNLNRLEGAIGE